MTLKLHTFPGNFRAFKILIAAEYNGLEIEIPQFDVKKDGKSPQFLAMSPAGKVPVLETPQGSIFESNAIARYIARMRRDTDLYGVSFFESGLVDSWIGFCTHEVELPATLWFYPIIGYLPANQAVTDKAKADLANALQILDKHLLDKTYLVGDKITLADITVASALVYPYKIAMSPEYRDQFPNVLRWFLTLVNQPQFKVVVGEVVLAEKELLPSSVSVGGEGAVSGKAEKKEKGGKAPKEPKKAKEPKAAKAPKAPKEEKPKVEAPKEPDAEDVEEQLAKEEKKRMNEHPLKVLDREKPSDFVMDSWKKLYSNTSDYNAVMEEFWTLFDSEGWSLWYCSYNYNEELVKLFMTCNLVSGFLQRTDEIRRWAFGVMWITGEDKKEGMHISGAWLFRGQSDEYIKAANPDAEYYTWTKVPVPVSDEEKARLKEFWCSETTMDGRPVLECKVFK